jgi:hypothetical protein
MSEPRRPIWMIEQDIEQVEARLQEALATRDGMRLSSAVTRRGITRRIANLDHQLSLLYREKWDDGGVECNVPGCEERLDEARAFETLGKCEGHWAVATGSEPHPLAAPPPVTANTLEPPSIGGIHGY